MTGRGLRVPRLQGVHALTGARRRAERPQRRDGTNGSTFGDWSAVRRTEVPESASGRDLWCGVRVAGWLAGTLCLVGQSLGALLWHGRNGNTATSRDTKTRTKNEFIICTLIPMKRNDYIRTGGEGSGETRTPWGLSCRI